jgi:hypothetical protein
LNTIIFEEGSNLQTIGTSAFSMAGLESLVLPASLRNIGNGCFTNMYSLKTVEFEEGSILASIGDQAFQGTDAMKSIIIPASVTYVGSDAFNYNFTSNLNIYTSLTAIPSSWALNWNPKDRPVYFNYEKSLNDGNLLYRVFNDGYAHVDCLVNQTLTNIEIPNTIEEYVVTHIAAGAFYSNYSIESLTISASIKSIGSYALYNMDKLTSLIFEENSQLESIGSYAFANSDNVNFKEIIIPISVTTLEINAFHLTYYLWIKVEAAEKPSGWDDQWNGNNDKIIWGNVV